MGRPEFSVPTQSPREEASRVDNVITSFDTVSVAAGAEESTDITGSFEGDYRLIDMLSTAYIGGNVPDDAKNIMSSVSLVDDADNPTSSIVIVTNPDADGIANPDPPLKWHEGDGTFSWQVTNDDAQDIEIGLSVVARRVV